MIIGGRSFMVMVINLETAPDRMAHMQRELDRVGLSFVRQAAVVGARLTYPHPGFSEWSYRYLHGRLWAPRELGCYLSHIECLKNFLKSEADYALILEDDVTFSDDIVRVLEDATAHSSLWNMLRLSTVNSGKWWGVRRVGTRQLSVCLTREKGAGAYVVDRHSAERMTKYLQPMRLAWDIAFDLEWFMGFKTLGVYPMPVSQKNDFETQIQQDLKSIKIRGYAKYITVLPFRLFIESTRVIYRMLRLVRLKMIWK